MDKQAQAERYRLYRKTDAGKAARKRANDKYAARPEIRLKAIEATKRWIQNNPERHKLHMQKWKENNPGRMLAYQRKWKYGITPAALDAIVLSQNGSCAICLDHFDKDKQFHVDHCHNTGTVRGLLCHGCNTGLGKFRDDYKRMVLAAAYITRYLPETVPEN